MKRLSLLLAFSSIFIFFSQCSSTTPKEIQGKWKVETISVGGKKTNAPEEMLIELKESEISAPVFGASGSPKKENITRKFVWLDGIVKLEGSPSMIFAVKKEGDSLTLSSGAIPLPIVTTCKKVTEEEKK
ncbi:MAG: hypothetical protein AAF518_04025 [Spirochaetota bacterium]